MPGTGAARRLGGWWPLICQLNFIRKLTPLQHLLGKQPNKQVDATVKKKTDRLQQFGHFRILKIHFIWFSQLTFTHRKTKAADMFDRFHLDPMTRKDETFTVTAAVMSHKTLESILW